jgi:type IV pilus assembly protein PilC
MLRQRSPNPKLRLVLADVESRITSGSALSDALAAQGETFPRIYTASILAGERSGNLDDVLRRYVEYTKAIAQLSRKIRGALTSPGDPALCRLYPDWRPDDLRHSPVYLPL